MKRTLLLIATSAIAQPAQAQSALQTGLDGALKGCEEWVLNPASWSEGIAPFIASTGLGTQIGLVDRVEEVNLPPPSLRAGNHYWRINSTASAGYVLVTSDRLPMCHITGGGDADLQPVVEATLTTPDFNQRWEKQATTSRKGMISTTFRNREEPAFSLVISRAEQPDQRTDRVQVIATASYQLQK